MFRGIDLPLIPLDNSAQANVSMLTRSIQKSRSPLQAQISHLRTRQIPSVTWQNLRKNAGREVITRADGTILRC